MHSGIELKKKTFYDEIDNKVKEICIQVVKSSHFEIILVAQIIRIHSLLISL